jgi:hypothetical protein
MDLALIEAEILKMWGICCAIMNVIILLFKTELRVVITGVEFSASV